MVSDGKGRLFRGKDGRYMIYLPVDLAQDSMFPIKVNSSVPVKISFKPGEKELLIEKLNKEQKHREK